MMMLCGGITNTQFYDYYLLFPSLSSHSQPVDGWADRGTEQGDPFL